MARETPTTLIRVKIANGMVYSAIAALESDYRETYRYTEMPIVGNVPQHISYESSFSSAKLVKEYFDAKHGS